MTESPTPTLHELIGARPRTLVEREYRNLRQRSLCDGPDAQFAHGALDAYRWTMGGGGAPLTGARAAGVPDLQRLTSEIDAAVVQLDDATQRASTRDFTRGVHDALAWVCGLSDNRP